MDMLSLRKASIIALLLLCCPSIAYANFVWPALIAESRINSVPVILISLILECFVIIKLFKVKLTRGILYTLVANLASGLLGLLLRPLSGIAYEFFPGSLINYLFDWGTFNPVAWFFVPVIGGAINAFIELVTIRLVFKQNCFWVDFFIFWAANWVTVGIATVWVVIAPPAI